MTGVDQVDGAVGIQLRLDGFETLGVARLGEGGVQRGQRLDDLIQLLGLVDHAVGQDAQDALDLLMLLELALPPIVGHVDGGERLQEQRGAALRLVVDDAADVVAVVGFDGDDVVARAHSDMLGGRLNVAQAALQGRGFEQRGGTDGARHAIDHPHGAVGGEGARLAERGLGSQ